MKLEVITPEENMGDVMGDLNRRRGQMQGVGEKSGSQVVKSLVPLSEMFGYVTQLRTITSGRANSTMECYSIEKLSAKARNSNYWHERRVSV